MPELQQTEANEDRRKFLATCGKFAVLIPPAITIILSTSLDSSAGARSRGRIRKSGAFGKATAGFAAVLAAFDEVRDGADAKAGKYSK